MRSQGFWAEVTRFQIDESGRPEAPRGYHDDRIFAAGLSEYLRHNQPTPRVRSDGRVFGPRKFDFGDPQDGLWRNLITPARPRRMIYDREDRRNRSE